MLDRKITSITFGLLLYLAGLFFVSPEVMATGTPFVDDVNTFPITRVIRDSQPSYPNPISNTFGYTITPVNTNPSGATGEPTSAQIIFSSVTPTYNPNTGYLEATATGYVDFSNTVYSSVGTYYYDIRETSTSDPLPRYYTDNKTYRIKVEVVYETDPVTEVPINSSLIAKINPRAYIQTDGVDFDTKVDSATWTSMAQWTIIGATATTRGNLGDTSHCFEYTLHLNTDGDVRAGEHYTMGLIQGSDITTPATCAPQGSGGIITITPGQDVTFSLAHGETMYAITPQNASYIITASASDISGYITTIDGNTINTIAKTPQILSVDAIKNEYNNGIPTDNLTILERFKEASVVVGILTNIWTYVILLAFVCLSVYVIYRRSSKNDSWRLNEK